METTPVPIVVANHAGVRFRVDIRILSEKVREEDHPWLADDDVLGKRRWRDESRGVSESGGGEEGRPRWV